uniref:RING-type E3 ubiquitin transferase n=1 Tax=Anthurium amnicola TaxID=1678845 RepID=A0A1D1XHX7_9ARAE
MATPAPSSPTDPGPSSSELNYYIAAVAAVALLLVLYNAIAVGWCSQHCPIWRRWGFLQHYRGEAAAGPQSSQVTRVIPLYKYRKEDAAGAGKEPDGQCSVCLSVFAEGEDVRRLPKCEHLFHAPCIDTWLSSHASCPLCRACVVSPAAPAAAADADVEDPARVHPQVES